MRTRVKNDRISVQAIAGTEVVLLGINAEDEAINGLLGFQIYKKNGADGKYYPLSGGRTFETASTNTNSTSQDPPVQSFMWSDYVVQPNLTYTYKVVPVYGTPEDLKPGDALEITISTEDLEDEKNAIFFNRGVAGSQAYSRRFGDYLRWYKVEDFKGTFLKDFIKPEDIPNREAYIWLSRGLEEAMKGFIDQATDSQYSIRAAVYEFTYIPVIQKFVDALERGVDVKIIHHAKRESSSEMKSNANADTTVTYKDGSKTPVSFKNKEVEAKEVKDSVCSAADNALKKIGLKDPKFKAAFDTMMIERKDTTISHNKFIILLKDGKPIQVWTGSTNYTDGGIFGQSNVGHIVRDEAVAQRYLEYWQKLSTDPIRKTTKSKPRKLASRTGQYNNNPIWWVHHHPIRLPPCLVRD